MMRSTSILILRIRKLLIVVTRLRLLIALVRTGVLAASEHRPLLARPWRTVIDVGANRGQFTLAALELTNAKIIAFEPLAEPAEVFRAATVNEGRVRLVCSAIGQYAGQSEMHVSKSDDSSSLLAIGAEQSRLFPGTETTRRETVTIQTLDASTAESEIQAPALLKLDVQGYEYEALLGCSSLLHAFDSVYCECSFIELYVGQKLAPDVISLLAAHSFVVAGIYNASYDENGCCIQADILFDRTSEAQQTKRITQQEAPNSCGS